MPGGDGSVIKLKTLLAPSFQGKNVSQEKWDSIFGKKEYYWEKNKGKSKENVVRRPG